MIPIPNFEQIKVIVAVVLVGLLIWAGIWFRGVLAENKEMKVSVEALTGEVERMNKQDAIDQVLFENVSAQKAILDADLQKQALALRKLREKLNEKTMDCFNLVLPAAYLDGLPQAPH